MTISARFCPTCRRVFPSGPAGASECPEHGPILRDDPLLGQHLSGYTVAAWLAEGLYHAIQPTSGAHLLLRVLPARLTTGETLADVLGEIRAASAMTGGHGVLPVEGGTLPDGRCYYLFSWARDRAEPLAHLLRRAPLPLPEALRVGAAICRALIFAHRVGLYHNDLCGEVVLIERDAPGEGGELRALVLDLGPMRRLSRVDLSLSDPRIDVSGVGALLYQLATGTALQSTTAFAGAGADLPAEFQAVVLRAVAPRREDRQPGLANLHADIQGLLAELRPLPAPRRRQRRLVPVLTAGLLGIGMGGGLVLWLALAGVLWRLRPPEPVAPPPPPAPVAQAGERGAPGAAPHLPPAVRARALVVLAEAQHSPDPAQRYAAAHLIGRSGDRRLRPLAEQLLVDPDPKVAAHAAWALGVLGDRAAVVALGQLGGERGGEAEGEEAGVALVRLGDRRGLEVLRGFLHGQNDGERLEAALWLGENNEVEAWRVLRHLLSLAQDENPLEHLTILGRLCRGRDQAACQQLREKLAPRPGGGYALRGQARMLLGAGLMQAGDPLGYEVLEELAQDPAQRLPALRWLAEGGLRAEDERWLIGRLGEARSASPSEGGGANAKPPLKEPPAERTDGEDIKAGPPLKDGRAQAAEALGLAGSRAALPALEKALEDDDPRVRQAAAGAVLRLGALEPRDLLRRGVDWAQSAMDAARPATRAVAAAVLATARGREAGADLAVPLLARLAGDREAEVRLAAVHALGAFRSPLALPVLSQALADRDGAVRVAAVQALGRLDTPEAMALVRERLDRGSLLEQVAAVGLLLLHGEQGHRFLLRQALQSPDIAVRRLAIEQGAQDPNITERVGLLAAGLADSAEEIRLLAAVSLARSGDRRGAEVLKASAGVVLAQRLLGREALLRLDEKVPNLDIVAVLGAAGEGQRGGAMAVARDLSPDLGLAVVRRGLHDVAMSVRLQAVAAAAELPQDRRVREQLLLQGTTDTDEAVAQRAASLLGVIQEAGR